jgi:hypothetical protein
VSQEQLIAIDEENASLRSERTELHALLNDTAQELDRVWRALIIHYSSLFIILHYSDAMLRYA